MTYKILIADDTPTNKKWYESIINCKDFNVEWSKSEEGFINNLDKNSYDAFIFDVHLDAWPNKFTGNINLLPEKAIVFLATSNFEQGKETILRVVGAIDRMKKFTISTLAIDLIELDKSAKAGKKNSNGYHETINDHILNTIKINDLSIKMTPNGSQEIGILHISDLQLGSKDPSKWSTNVCSEIVRLVRGRHDKEVHFLVVSGDITETGAPEDFREAEKILRKMAIELWGDNGDKLIPERILIVPGNHDVNLSLAAACKIEFNFKDKKVNVKEDRNNTSLRHYALSPFNEFYRNIVGLEGYSDQDNPNKVVTAFDKIGVRFHLINSVSELNCDQEEYASFKPNKNRAMRNENILNIAISHHGIYRPDEIKDEKYPVLISNPEQMLSFFKEQNISLHLHGHGHARAVNHFYVNGREVPSINTPVHSDTFVQVMSPTSHLNETQRPAKEKRGFNFITICKNKETSSPEEIKVQCFTTEDGFDFRRSGAEEVFTLHRTASKSLN